MATKKVYPFIHARMAEDNEALEGHVITFDAREVHIITAMRNRTTTRTL